MPWKNPYWIAFYIYLQYSNLFIVLIKDNQWLDIYSKEINQWEYLIQFCAVGMDLSVFFIGGIPLPACMPHISHFWAPVVYFFICVWFYLFSFQSTIRQLLAPHPPPVPPLPPLVPHPLTPHTLLGPLPGLPL